MRARSAFVGGGGFMCVNLRGLKACENGRRTPKAPYCSRAVATPDAFFNFRGGPASLQHCTPGASPLDQGCRSEPQFSFVKDRPQVPPAASRQPPPTAHCQPPPTANHCSTLFPRFSRLHVWTMKQRASPGTSVSVGVRNPPFFPPERQPCPVRPVPRQTAMVESGGGSVASCCPGVRAYRSGRWTAPSPSRSMA